jgi:hypothetical protein
LIIFLDKKFQTTLADKLSPMTHTHTDPAIVLTSSEALRRKSIKKTQIQIHNTLRILLSCTKLKLKSYCTNYGEKKWNATSIHLFLIMSGCQY